MCGCNLLNELSLLKGLVGPQDALYITAIKLTSRVFKVGFTGLPFSKLTCPNGLTSVIPALGTCYFFV